MNLPRRVGKVGFGAGRTACVLAGLVAFAVFGADAVVAQVLPSKVSALTYDPQSGLAVHKPINLPNFPQNRFKGAEIEGENGVNIFPVYDIDELDNNTGFFDPELGLLRRTAFIAALEKWAENLEGNIDVEVFAFFAEQGDFVLAGASPLQFLAIPQAGVPNVLYPIALANQLTGEDQSEFSPDISIVFNSDLDDDRNADFKWYYGLDQNPPPLDFDFISTAVHEIGHGLGFADSAEFDGEFGGFLGIPNIYDLFLVNAKGNRLLELAPNPINVESPVFWAGVNGVEAWQEGFGGQGNVPLYSPSFFSTGSSISHLDTDTFDGIQFPRDLMTHATGTGPSNALHDPSSIVLGIMRDMGWNREGSVLPPPEPEPGESFDDHPDAPPICTDLGRPDPVVSGGGSIFIEQEDIDVFCFQVFSGEELQVELFSTSQFDNAEAEIVNPNGTDVIGSAERDDEFVFTATASGRYFIQVGSKSNAGEGSTFQYQVRVTLLSDSQEPTGAGDLMATARATPTIGVAPLRVTLTGGANQAIEVGEWDFGDGGFDLGEAVSHIYSRPGTYTARFTATGVGGSRGEATAVIRVLGEPNELPTANISASTTAGQAPLTVQFNGFGVDPDGQIIRFDWNFGDGDTGTGQNIEHTFTSNEAFNVVLTVTDDVGETGTDIIQVIVGNALAAGGNNSVGQPVPGVAPMCGATSGLTYALTLAGFLGVGLLRRRW